MKSSCLKLECRTGRKMGGGFGNGFSFTTSAFCLSSSSSSAFLQSYCSTTKNYYSSSSTTSKHAVASFATSSSTLNHQLKHHHRSSQVEEEEEEEEYSNNTNKKKKTTKHGALVVTGGGGAVNNNIQDYFQVSKELVIRSNADCGPPRWFSIIPTGTGVAPLDRLENSPLLLFLPGVDGVGSGLALQTNALNEIFEVWCLHIPLSDPTPFTELVKMVEETVRSENSRRPAGRPIYLVGESLGGCLALAIASRNPHLHLVLILANPATCFSKSQMHALLPFSEMMPDHINLPLFYILTLVSAGFPSRMALDAMKKRLPLQHTLGELSDYISVLADLLSVETLNWKRKMLKSAEEFVNSRLHAVRARTLILSSVKDPFLPSQKEAERLRRLLPNCDIRSFSNGGHVLFLEDDFDLVTVIKGAGFYQRGRLLDYVSDYLPPKPSEFKQIYEPHRWTEVACNPVVLSTLENGKIVRGLSGIPSQGPVLFVGYHMMLGFELIPLVARFWTERSIVLRGIAHPMAFKKLKDGKLPDLSTFDTFRSMGAVPVSATNFYKLLSSKSHVLLYPGGMREALHRKGEEHKLIWPEQSEFVRMAARFGAKIIPFGAVGEDDFGQLVFDYDDLMKIPYFKGAIEELSDEAVKLRRDVEGEVGNQDIHLPIILPKLPGRLYFLFGKPIETEGKQQELKRREEAQRVYVKVKSEVESYIGYLKEKRENDPYRNIVARLTYQAMHGFDAEVPSFDV